MNDRWVDDERRSEPPTPQVLAKPPCTSQENQQMAAKERQAKAGETGGVKLLLYTSRSSAKQVASFFLFIFLNQEEPRVSFNQL